MGVKELERARKCFKSALKRQTYARRDAQAKSKELDQEMRIVRQEVFGSSEESSEANNELARTLQKIQEMTEEESRKCRRRLEKMQTKFNKNNDEQEDKILGAQLTDFTNDSGLPH